MKKCTAAGIAAGIILGTAAAVAVKKLVDKISDEIKNDLIQREFLSPFGGNQVDFSYGSSETAKDLAIIKLRAETDMNEDVCKFLMLSKKDDAVSYEWSDNDHFRLLVGNGKHRQCCDVTFETEKITMVYCIVKNQ